MDDEIDKEIGVLARRLQLLQCINSPDTAVFFDNSAEAEAEQFHARMARDFPDVLDRFAFLDTLQQAYVGDESVEPLMLVDGS
jgi:hypothetical protein